MKFYYTDIEKQEKYIPYLKLKDIGIENEENKLKEKN